MRILHVLSQEVLTGAEVYAATLVESQVKAGHNVFSVSTRFHSKFLGETFLQDFSSSKILIRFAAIKFLRKFLKDKQIDVIHCHSRAACRNVFWAVLGLRNVAVVSTVHGRQHASFGKKIMDIYGSYIIAISDNVKTHLVQDFKMNPRKIKVIGNPIDGTQFKAITKDRPAKIAIVGRSSGPKGEMSKKICREVLFPFLKQNPSVQMTIVASEPQKFGEEFLSELKTFKEQITLHGEQGKLAVIYNDHALVVGAGRVAMEALFCETPVIALGEYSCHGLVTNKNWDEVVASNFGDIGVSKQVSIDWPRIRLNVDDFFKSRNDFSEIFKKARALFSKDLVFTEVDEVYKQSIFKAHTPAWIPILMYHKIPDAKLDTKHRIFVTKETFEKHLQFFSKNGFTTLHFKELADFWHGKKPWNEFPKKPLILTFDDGYLDNLTNALPLLETYKAKVNVFLLANHSITENTWDAKDEVIPSKLMSLDEKKIFSKSPLIEIGSHGFNHLHLPAASEADLQSEISRSKFQLEKDLNCEIHSFAYPFGSIDAELWKRAKSAGYDFAVNTDKGGLSMDENRWSLFRVNIFPEDTNFDLWKKTSSWYRKYFFLKKK